MKFRNEHERQLWIDTHKATFRITATQIQSSEDFADLTVLAFRERNTPDEAIVPPTLVNDKPEMAWRDAQPDDPGKGYKCRVSDGILKNWEYTTALLDTTNRFENQPGWQMDNGLVWAFCQVYAPIDTVARDGWLPIESLPPKEAGATWVLCIDRDTSEVYPINLSNASNNQIKQHHTFWQPLPEARK